MAYTPERGDIVRFTFDPSAGQEIQGLRPGLVLSAKQFNRLGLIFICPISQGSAAAARSLGTVVTLMNSGTETQGAVHCHQLKSLDWRQRKAQYIEKAPNFIVDDVVARLETILF